MKCCMLVFADPTTCVASIMDNPVLVLPLVEAGQTSLLCTANFVKFVSIAR